MPREATMGSRNPKNAKALLAAGEITQSEYDSMMKPKGKMKKKSLIEKWKELVK
ncbi:MAG: hypothetical protein GY746_10865 [Gammaproteobacteria bacterium]|nr:hypothetical protein [Gammaproteobacteria bacterium]